MDFARKQMQKYGWKEGEGIGKEGNQGIKTAIKAKYKHGKEGMGFDLSKDLVDTWWTRAYTDSLARININSATSHIPGEEDEGEGVTVSFLQDASGGDEMSKMRRRMMRSNFVEFSKGAVLDKGMMVEEENSDSETDSGIATPSSSNSSTTLEDELLFKACGGRTAHKAARFGHKLSGKLARLAAQEQAELLATSQKATTTIQSIHSPKKVKVKKTGNSKRYYLETETPEIEKKRKKKSTKSEAMAVDVQIEEEDFIVEEMDCEPIFSEEKKRRKRRH